ncbi:Mus7/MMS22 family-domain-containing protein [Aspergillus floccosus]
MESWRERGFVPDSDEEDGFDSQNSLKANDNTDAGAHVSGDVERSSVSADTSDDDDELGSYTPTQQRIDRRIVSSNPGEDGTPTAAAPEDRKGSQLGSSSQREDPPRTADFSQTLSDAHEPSPPSTPQAKPQLDIWDALSSSPDELQLDFLPSRRRNALARTQNESQLPEETEDKNEPNDEISPLSSPLSSIHSLSSDEPDSGAQENGAQQQVENPPQDNFEDVLAPLNLPEDVLRELSQPARRSLRQRNPIQLHPYLLEDAKYRRLMKQGGIRPIRIAQYREALRAAAQASENREYGEDTEPPPSSPGVNLSSPPSSPVAARRISAEGSGTAILRRPTLRASDLLNRSPGDSSQRPHKRRKVARPADDEKYEQLRRMVIPQVVIDTSPSSTRMDSDSIFDNPQSPPRSGSVSSPQTTNHKEFRFPRGFSPPSRNTPRIRSTAERRDNDHHEADPDLMDWSGLMFDEDPGDVQSVHSQSQPDSDREQDNESDEQEEEQSSDENAVRELRRRIKGVLPASWLRLDQQKRTEDRFSSTQRNRDSRQENARGVARKITKRGSTRPSSPKGHLKSLRELADHESSDGSDKDVDVDSRQELARLVGFDDPFMDQDMGDDILEDNRIDYMFPSNPRGPSVPGTKKSSSKRPSQSRPGSRFTDLNKRPRLKRQARLTDPIYGARKESRTTRAPPIIGILDAPDVASRPRNEQPQFLRVAARNARSRRDRGRRSPSRKVFQLSSRVDTEDANVSLRQWRKGKLRQTRLSGYQTKPHERQALADLSSNQKETLGSLVAKEISKTSRTQDRSTNHPQEDRGPNALLRPEAPVPDPAPGNGVTKPKPTEPYRQGHNWIVRRNVAISSLKRNAPRPAISDLVGGTTGSAGLQTPLSTLNRSHQPRRLPKGRDVNLLLDRFLGSSPADADKPRRTIEAPVPTQSDDMLPTARLQIRRPKVRKRPPRRIDVNAPERQETLAPLVLEDEPFGLVDESPQQFSRQGGLSGYRRSYTIDFNITPLQPGTFFHESTFIGSGEFSRALALGKRDLDHPASVFHLHAGTLSFRWGPWNDTVSSEIGTVFNTILEEVERSHTSAEQPGCLSHACALYRSLVKYCADSLTFIDPIDRAGFIRRAHGLVSRLNDSLATLPETNNGEAGWLARISAYNLVFANQMYRIACHDVVAEGVKVEAVEVLKNAARQVAMLISMPAGRADICKFLDENKSDEKREAGVREDHPCVDAYVIAYHVLHGAEGAKGSFEKVFAEAYSLSDAPDKARSSDISWMEDRWYLVFTMLPLSEVDAAGIARIGSRFREAPDSWTIPERLVRPVLDSYDPKSETPISYNNYCRTLFHRCLHLINAWGWRDCKRILDTLYDFFAKNTLYNLEHEESYGSPSFLDELDRAPSFDINFGEPCFHVLLKVIASGLRFLAQRYDKKKIRNFAWRLLPNHGRVYPKEKPLQQTDLAALRNHHDLLCTLYFAVPDGCRPRLEAIKNLVDPASSHRETCNISLRSWARLVRFKLLTNEDVSGLEQFADWHSYFVTELLKQHGLARREIEAQNTGGNKFSHQLIERTIAENQRHIESLLKTALNGLKSAINAAPTAEHAEKLARKAPLNVVLGLFNPRVSRVNTTVSEALQVILSYLQKCNTVSPVGAANPSTEEDSQDYGDWTAIEAFYEGETTSALPQGIELVEKSFHPEVSRLLSNCFGEDDCPEDAILLSVVDCWTSIAQTLVKHGLRHWDSYLSRYDSDSWAALRSTIQTRKYTPKFLASCIEKDNSFVAECKVHAYSLWMSCLVERSSLLKFQHCLTEALLNGDNDNPMLQNLPFYRDVTDGRYSVTLEDLRQRRLSLISSILSNMRAHVLRLEEEGGRDLSTTRQEYRELVQEMMSSMKSNYQELGTGTKVAQGDYVEFVHRVVGFLQQYTRDICPVDQFFTDPSSFPLPLDDPTYIVARVKSYEPKLSSGKSAKALIVFIQSASERAAIDRRQTYFVEQLHASMEEAYESGDPSRPTLRAFLFQSAFPAYLKAALSSPAGWILSRPIIQTIMLTFEELLFNINTTDPRCVSSLVDIFSSVFRASYQSLLTIIDNTDRLKEPPIILTISSMIEMITAALCVVDYIDRATDAGDTLISQVRIFRQIILFITSHIHDCPLSDPSTEDFATFAEVFTNDPPTHSQTAAFFREIGLSATRELQAYINESWSRHQGRYYFTRRGCHQPQEVQIEPAIAAGLATCPTAEFDDAAGIFFETLEALDLFGTYD